MAAISTEHLTTDHSASVNELKDKIQNTQSDHAALNVLMNTLDHFDRYSSFSNLLCRFVLMGTTGATTGITLSSVQGGAYIWLTAGLLGSTLAMIGAVSEHENRKKELENLLAECTALVTECDELEKKLSIDGKKISNADLIGEIINAKGIKTKRKHKKLIASVLGVNPYSLDFDALAMKFAAMTDSGGEAISTSTDSDDAETDVTDKNNTNRNKVTIKQIVSYIVNFIASFGTGAGFVYWGAMMFGAATPFGWALILAGVLVGVLVGGIFVAQQIRMEHMHQPIDEAANEMRDALTLRKKLLKQYNKINEMNANVGLEAMPAEPVERVLPNLHHIPAERQHLYGQKVPDARKHLFRAGAISYNAVLGFVIGFGLVLTFAFVTGGAGLIPGLIIGAAFSGYFIYAGADGALSAEQAERAKGLKLKETQTDCETYWASKVIDGFDPVAQLGKSNALLAFNLIERFHDQAKYNIDKHKFMHRNKVLNLLSTVTNINFRRKKDIDDACFDALYAYFISNLSVEIEQDEDLTPEKIKDAVLLLKKKVLGKKDVSPIQEPKIPVTLRERLVHWVKENINAKNIPKIVFRLFAIIGILTLGAAIPFMIVSGGIALPAALGVLMVAILAAYIIREVMEYRREQEMADMDNEILKYETIDCMYEVMKPTPTANVSVKEVESEVSAEEEHDSTLGARRAINSNTKAGMLKTLGMLGGLTSQKPIPELVTDEFADERASVEHIL